MDLSLSGQTWFVLDEGEIKEMEEEKNL